MKKQLRLTNQREVILDELSKSTSHPTADNLYERVKKKLPRISLATVYRNLEILSEAGLIKKLEISGRQKRFDWDLEQHDHIYCIECHRIDNIDLENKKEMHLTPEDSKGYQVSGCRVEFFGLCPKCKKKHQRAASKEVQEMAYKAKCGSGALSAKQRKVLEALAQCTESCGSKDIAAATSLEPKQISCQITALKKKGYVASPARCQYEITNKGKGALA
ncbi:MAG: Fur family transcriptional regulator [Desulfobulbaceae bacterium]|nr:Fur family transcriptional regulator [Desulfobulbaceae bacterium]